MVKSNLAVLMAERGLKMVDVIEQTGIAKATIQGLYHNTNKAIHYQTIDVLCNFFNVSVGELLLHIKSNIELVSVKKIHPLRLEYQIRVKINDKITDYHSFADINRDEDDEDNFDKVMVSLHFLKETTDLMRFFPNEELHTRLFEIIIEGAVRTLKLDPKHIEPSIFGGNTHY